MNLKDINLKFIIKQFNRLIRISCKIGLLVSLISGIYFIFLIVFSFTTYPFWIYHWLGTSKIKEIKNPHCIIVMGGSGMPGESALIRTYYAAELWHKFPKTNVIVALPGDTNVQNSSVCQMKQELILRGIDSTKINYEPNGTNTRAQALNIYHKFFKYKDTLNIVLVTSPEHMRRSVLTFQKLGFKNVNGYSAFEIAIESDITFNEKKLGGKKLIIPEVGKNISIRYQFWNHIKYEIEISREFAALAYYKLKGWI